MKLVDASPQQKSSGSFSFSVTKAPLQFRGWCLTDKTCHKSCHVSHRWLTCTVDVLETLLCWIHESLLHIYLCVPIMLLVSVVAVMSVSIHITTLLTRTPSPAFTSISSSYWHTNVDGLMICGQIYTVLGHRLESSRYTEGGNNF